MAKIVNWDVNHQHKQTKQMDERLQHSTRCYKIYRLMILIELNPQELIFLTPVLANRYYYALYTPEA